MTLPFPEMNMRHLRAIVAIGDRGTLSAAAQDVALSQPALTQRLSKLERMAGTALFERQPEGMTPTAAGLIIARRVQAATTMLTDASDAARPRSGGRGFHRADILLTMGAHSELNEPLRDVELDFLVGALRNPPPGPDVVQEALLVDEVAIVARREHPLFCNGKRPDLAALTGCSWLAPPSGTPLRRLWERLCAEAELPLPDIWMECGSVTMMTRLLLADDHIALLSPVQVRDDLLDVRLVTAAVGGATGQRTIGITTRAGWSPTPAQARFPTMLRLIREQAQV